jgi:short-subunit dehydrogenase
VSGSHAIVVGASSGIGLSVAAALRARGHAVSNLARRRAPGGAVDASYACDVTSSEQVTSAVAQAIAVHGPCDVLVYASGVGAMGRTTAIPEEDARRCFEVNFWGLDRVVRATLPAMMDRRRGSILAISSLVALRAVPFEAYYAASKAAVTRYLGCLAHEARKGNVRVQALHIGLIDTGFFERGGWHGMDVPRVKGSGVTPSDVAEATLRLLDSGSETALLGWKERVIALGDRFAPTMYDRLLRLKQGIR